MKLIFLVVDDEPLARKRLSAMLTSLHPNATIDQAKNGNEALGAIATRRYHALLLDIKMPGLDGLSLSKQLRQLPNPPAIVFTTAHAKFALEAFTFPAVSYLLKPIELDALKKALEDVNQRLAPSLEQQSVLLEEADAKHRQLMRDTA